MLSRVAADRYDGATEGGGSLPADHTATHDGDAHLIFWGQQAIVLGLGKRKPVGLSGEGDSDRFYYRLRRAY